MQGAMKWSDFTPGFGGKQNARSSIGPEWNCPDTRWHPAVRVAVFVVLASLAWGAVILLAVLAFGA